MIKMRMNVTGISAITGLLATLLTVNVSASQVLRETYTARLSEADHFSSKGERIMTPAGILRQDRANFHRFGVRDPEDSSDDFFADANNRGLMERYLINSSISSSARRAIVNGTPLVRVSIYRLDDGGDFVRVEVAP